MKYLSVCSGIEAASAAWHSLGWQPLAFSEIETFPRAVLAHHYPNVPVHGDFTQLRDQSWIEDADVLVGGTPCQAFSVAGLRKSLSDDRGNLSLEFVRLADAIDNIRANRRRDPCVIVWENVPGVLSVKDNAFGCFLAGLAGDVTPYVPPRGKWTDAGVVDGPQRTVAWRVLDAQYFGLAQRRRRVFVVASAREGFDPAAVLLEFEGVRRDTAPSREAGEGTAHATAPCLTSSGRGVERTDDTRGQDPVVAVGWPAEIAGTLDAHFGDKQGLEDQHVNAGCPLFVPSISPCLETQVGGLRQPCTQAYVVTPPLTASMATPLGNGGKDDFIVPHSLRAEGFDASEDGTGRGTPLVPVLSNDPAHAICANEARTYTNEGSVFQLRNVVGEPVAYSIMPQNSGKDYKAREVEVAQPIMAGGPVGGNQGGDYIMQPVAVAFDWQMGAKAGSTGAREEQAGTLGTTKTQAVAYAQSGETGKGDAAPCVAVHLDVFNHKTTGDIAGVVREQHGTNMNAVYQPHMAVRRLTPVECERLQGFPDNYTNIPWRGKPEAPDGPRYKALGNSMAVPVMRWIGRRIAEQVK